MLTPENTVLVVVDVQGRLASLMHGKEEFYDNVVKMIRGATVLELPVLWNEQLPDKLGGTIAPVAEALKGLEPFVKKTFSCCGQESFMKELTRLERQQVLLVGMETHVCVYQTAIDLLGEGFDVYLVVDAVSSRSSQNKEIGIKAMSDAGVRITSVEMSLFEMLRVAEGDKLKEIIRIVR